MNATQEHVNERRSRRRWLGFICAFFAAQALLWTMALTFVSGDTSHAIVASYDARALDWDAQQDRRMRSEALGWHAKIGVDQASAETNARTIEVELHDRSDSAVIADDIQLTLFHHASASERQRLSLRAVSPGVYRGSAPLGRPGKWRFEVEASRGDDSFVHAESRVLDFGRARP